MHEEQTLIAVKILTIVFLFVISMSLGVLPAKWDRFKQNPRLIGFANTFAAGLFLGVGLFHILPEGVADYEKYRSDKHLDATQRTSETFPLMFFISACSYAVILFIDKVLFTSHDLLDSYPSTEQNIVKTDTNKEDADDLKKEIILERNHSEIKSLLEGKSLGNKEMMADENELDPDEDAFKSLMSFTSKIGRKIARSVQRGSPLKKEHTPQLIKNDNSKLKEDEEIQNLIKTQANVSENDLDNKSLVEDFAPYILLIALSLHAVFEGVAIGLGRDVGPTVNLAAAVIIHKWAEALALGISLLKANASNRTLFTMVTIFSIASPLGILIGWALLKASLIWSAVFKAIAAGTFLYLSATEIAVEEFSITKNRFSKYICYMFGLGLVAVATYYEG